MTVREQREWQAWWQLRHKMEEDAYARQAKGTGEKGGTVDWRDHKAQLMALSKNRKE